MVSIVRKYVSLRPKVSKCNRFFLGYKHGKCINQPMGINTLGDTPKKIAKFLNSGTVYRSLFSKIVHIAIGRRWCRFINNEETRWRELEQRH